MKKRIITFLTALCMMTAPVCAPVGEIMQTSVTVHAEQHGVCGENLTWTLDYNGTLTISGNGVMSNTPFSADLRREVRAVVIEYGVMNIGNEAFKSFSFMSSVSIPNSVTRIGQQAFYGCESLGSVTIPDNVRIIDQQAFSDCRYLNSVTIGSGVRNIESGAFNGCRSLGSVTIPANVESIGSFAFTNCSSLSSVTIQNPSCQIDNGDTFTSGNYKDGYVVFNGTIRGYSGSTAQSYAASHKCSFTVIDSVQPTDTTYSTIPEGTTNQPTTTESVSPSNKCGDNVTWKLDDDGTLTISGTGKMYDYSTDKKSPYYDNRYKVKKVVIQSGVTSIGNYAFYFCSDLTSVTIPDSVTSIGDYAFQDCRSLTSVTIPDSVTSIGSCAFEYCWSLTSVTIPDSVTSIGSFAFENCDSLTSVTIPDSVKSIGSNAFVFCDSLTSIKVSAGNATYTSIDGVVYSKDKKELVFYPSGRKGAFTIPDSVTSIGEDAFFRCDNLTSVTIPDSVTDIKRSAFRFCKSLTSVTIRNPKCTIYDDDGTFSNTYDSNNKKDPFTGTIYGYPGSTAQAYAEKYGRKFSALDGPQPTEASTSTTRQTTTTSATRRTTTTSSTRRTTTTSRTTHATPTTTTTTAPPETEGKCGNHLSWKFNKTTATLTIWGTGSMYDFEKYGYSGYVRYAPWEPLEESIRSVLIEDGVLTIGDNAFKQGIYKNLQSVSIAESVLEIGYNNFKSTPWLDKMLAQNNFVVVNHILLYAKTDNSMETRIEIPYSIGIKAIAPWAMRGDENLKTIVIPENVESIGEDAFSYCDNLKEVYIHNPNCEIFDGKCTFEDAKYFYGYENSTIQDYAKKYKRTFISLGVKETTTTACSTTTRKTTTTTTTTTTLSTKVVLAGKCGDSLRWKLDESGTMTISGTGAMYTYPDTDKHPWYGKRKSIIRTVIEKGATSISENAFLDCSNLKSVVIPNSVTSIEQYAFSNCSNLKFVEIPKSVTSIEQYAFSNCSSLTAVSIADGVKSIGGWAFNGCTGLVAVTLPESVESIGSSAFNECKKLRSVTVESPDCKFFSSKTIFMDTGTGFTIRGLADSTAQAYAEKYGYPFVTVESVPAGVACGDNLSWKLDDAGTLTISGTGKMYDFERLGSPFCSDPRIKKVVFKSGITSIGDFAFFQCGNITSVTLPDTVTKIGKCCFFDCPMLKTVTIMNPECEIYDEKYTFCNASLGFYPSLCGYSNSTADVYSQKYGCTFVSLDSPQTTETTTATTKNSTTTTFVSHPATTTTTRPTTTTSTTRPTTTTSTTTSTTSTTTAVTTPQTTTETSPTSGECGDDLTWKLDENGTLVISGGGNMYDYSNNDSPFYADKAIKKVVLRPGVTSVGMYAFSGCTNLTAVLFPDTLISIKGFSFSGCTNLTSVTIPDSVKSIGSLAFSECMSLTAVTIPENVTSIGIRAFSDCKSLTSVTILNKKCTIGDYSNTFCNTFDAKECLYTGTICGYTDSTAQAYAQKYGRKFTALDAVQTTEVTTSTTSRAAETATTSAGQTLALPQDTIQLRVGKTYSISPVRSGWTFVSLSPDIADVNTGGLVTALAKGTASVRITDSTGASAVLTVTVVSGDTAPYPLGNLNGDDAINAKDATMILLAAAKIGTGGETGFTDEQSAAADVNSDGIINAKDATAILRYAAAVGTGTAGKLTDYI